VASRVLSIGGVKHREGETSIGFAIFLSAETLIFALG